MQTSQIYDMQASEKLDQEKQLSPVRTAESVHQVHGIFTFVNYAGRWVDPALAFGAGFAEWLAIWAVGDQVFIGVMGGEASSPRYSMAHASTLVPIRVSFMYLVCVIFIGIIVPSDDPLLLGGSGSAASPFVIATRNSGLAGIPDFINVCMIIGILAIALESIYLPSRIIRTMAFQGLLPQVLAKCDDKGRPRWALFISAVVGVILSYLSLSSEGGGTTALNWFISITSASFFSNWAIIAFTNLRFHAALRAQNDKIFSQNFAWKSIAWPFAPIWGLIISSMLLLCLVYAAVNPSNDFSAENFFEYMIGLLMITVVIAGAGDLAQYLAEEFKVDNTHDVFLISRKERKFFTKLGVTTHEIDEYSADSVLAVLEKVNATVLISTLHTDDPALYTSLHKALLLACKASKTCKRFIPSEFLGNLRKFDNIPRGIARARRAFRSELLNESEIKWTLVNLGWLADYFVQQPDGSRSYISPFPQGWPINMEEGTVRVIGTGDEPVCWTAARDVAKAVVKLVSHDEWPDHIYVFGEIGSWNQAIEKVERYYGVSLTRTHVTQDDISRYLANESEVGKWYRATIDEWSLAGATAVPLEEALHQRERYFGEVKFRDINELLRSSEHMQII
ncbi:hypothetical protein KHU50_009264 [Colletotrichum sp. SAR 10_65]|nr:hypothetical protein KHU50_009264 [Colletotrichum sp. SAR 10_65]KAI8210768.1 hypothetical protein K4K52_011805 [Colletotrichum sp. SAR 10_76]